jgi:hypothetical protein
MEAWEQGLNRMKEDKIEKLLRQMDYVPIAQRLGYILATLNYKPRPELANALEEYLARLNPSDTTAYQQLFPGVKYDHLQYPWLVYGPT